MTPARQSFSFKGIGCRGNNLNPSETTPPPTDEEEPIVCFSARPCPLSKVQALVRHLRIVDDAQISTYAGNAKSSAPTEDPTSVREVGSNRQVAEARSDVTEKRLETKRAVSENANDPELETGNDKPNPVIEQANEAAHTEPNVGNPSNELPSLPSEEPMELEECKDSIELERPSGNERESGDTNLSIPRESNMAGTPGDSVNDVTGPASGHNPMRPLENSPDTPVNNQNQVPVESAPSDGGQVPRASAVPERDVNLLNQPAYEEFGDSLTVSLGQKRNDKLVFAHVPEQVSEIFKLGKVDDPPSSKRPTNGANDEMEKMAAKKRKTLSERSHQPCNGFIKALVKYANRNGVEARVQNDLQALMKESDAPRVPTADNEATLAKNDETAAPAVEPTPARSEETLPPSHRRPSTGNNESAPRNRVFELIKVKEPLPRGVRLANILKTEEGVTLMGDMWKRWCNNVHCDDQFQSLLDDSEVLDDIVQKLGIVQVDEDLLLEYYKVWPLATDSVAILHDALEQHSKNKSQVKSPSRKVTNARLILTRFLFYTQSLAANIRKSFVSHRDDEEGKEKRQAVSDKITAVEQHLPVEAKKCGKRLLIRSVKSIRSVALLLSDKDKQGRQGWTDLSTCCVEVFNTLKELKAPVPKKDDDASLPGVQKQKQKGTYVAPSVRDPAIDSHRIPKKPISAGVPNFASKNAGAGDESKTAGNSATMSNVLGQQMPPIDQHQNGTNAPSSANPESNQSYWIHKEPKFSILSTRKHGKKGSGRKTIQWKPGETEPKIVHMRHYKSQPLEKPVLLTLFRDLGSGESTLLHPQTECQAKAVDERLKVLTLGGIYKLYGILYSNVERVRLHYEMMANGERPQDNTGPIVSVPNFDTVKNNFGRNNNGGGPSNMGQ